MSIRALALAALPALLLAASAAAGVPRVAADIPPVHSLVARVMAGLGTPELIVQPGATPHGQSLRPSQARALQAAEAVFWVGPALTPWLAEPVASLAADARAVPLLEAPGTRPLPFRDGATFAGHGHGEAAGRDGDHAGDPAPAAPGGAAAGTDPHAWLDPETGKAWLDAIAATLSGIDPANAEAYAANAAQGRAEIDAAAASAAGILAPARDLRFVVFHDAYRYFERRFGLSAAGAIALSDASDPSPARIAEIRDAVRDLGVTCILAEPQFDPGLVRTVAEGADLGTGIVDPLGAGIAPGPDLYPALIRGVAGEIAACGG